MNTNISTYNGSFADFVPDVPAGTKNLCARQQGEYFAAYAKRFIPDTVLKLGTRVQKVLRKSDGWTVLSQREGSDQEIEDYDFLIVSTGTFSSPWMPQIPGLKENFKGKAIHSFHYDEANAISGVQKIVIVGGALSSVEIAADVALRVSSLPENERENIEVIHVMAKPPWIFPRYLTFPNPKDSTAPGVLPLDLVLSDARTGPEFKTPEERNEFAHGHLRTLVGSDQGNLSPALRVSGKWTSREVTIGMSASYSHFVRSGIIKPFLGRLSSVSADGGVEIAATGEGGQPLTLENVDLIYFATGFSALRFVNEIFEDQVLSDLGINSPDQDPTPFLQSLHNHTLHPAFHNMGAFAGMRRQLYTGQLEIQAQYIAGLFTGIYPWPSATDFANTAKGPKQLLSVNKNSEALLWVTGGAYVPWIKHMDNVMGTDHLSLAAVAPTLIKPCIPAYFPEVANTPIGQSTIAALHKDITETAFSQPMIARDIFAQLAGHWKINRLLKSNLPDFPSGAFVGTCEFHPRVPTFSVSEGHKVIPFSSELGTLGREITEYLYTESGAFTSNNQTYSVTRRYIYTLDPDTGGISVWFVKPDGETADYFFHELDFSKEPEKISVLEGGGVDADGGWKAAAEHLCEKDWYWPAYRFWYQKSQMERFWVRYKVKGPRKDYVSEAEYSRT